MEWIKIVFSFCYILQFFEAGRNINTHFLSMTVLDGLLAFFKVFRDPFSMTRYVRIPSSWLGIPRSLHHDKVFPDLFIMKGTPGFLHHDKVFQNFSTMTRYSQIPPSWQCIPRSLHHDMIFQNFSIMKKYSKHCLTEDISSLSLSHHHNKVFHNPPIRHNFPILIHDEAFQAYLITTGHFKPFPQCPMCKAIKKIKKIMKNIKKKNNK